MSHDVAPGSRRPSLLMRGLRQPRGLVGGGLVLLVIALATAGPLLAHYSPYEFVDVPYAPPGPGMPLGTDGVGRDVLSRLLFGGWSILWMSAAITGLTMLCGTALGLLAGHVGGRVDSLVMRGLDVVLAFPERVLVLVCVSVFGSPGWLLVLASALAFLPAVARAARAATLDVTHKEYVQYAEALGMPRRQILIREILPNIATPMLVEAGFRLTWSIGLIAGISFLGFGRQPPAADWGLMINEGREGLLFQPWAAAAPVACLAVFVIGANFLGDALAHAASGADRT